MLFTEQSLQDLKWPDPIDENTYKTCTPMQPLMVGVKLSSNKSAPGKLIDVQNADKLIEPYDTGLHIESQVGKGQNIVSSTTSSVCHSSNKSSLRVM